MKKILEQLTKITDLTILFAAIFVFLAYITPEGISESSINNLRTNAKTIASSLSAAETQTANANTRLQESNSISSDLRSSISELEGAIINLEAQVNLIDPATDQTSIDELGAEINQLNAEINELNTPISQLKNLNTIDILINNAGAIFSKKELNSKGLEKTFVVNYLSHFFLTLSLLNLIKNTENSRIINISSWVHELAKLNLNDINFSEKYNGIDAYNNTKLMNILFNYKINRTFTNSINTFAIHPGWINSNFGNYNQLAPRFIIKIARFLAAKNPNKIANQIYNLCTNDKYLNYSGKYLINNNVKKSSKLSYQTDLQDKLWEMSLQFTSLKNTI